MELSRTLNVDVICDKIHDIVSGIMKCDASIISSYRREDNTIRTLSVWANGIKEDASLVPPMKLAPNGSGIQSPVLRSGKPIIISDYAEAFKTSRNKFSYDEGKMLDEPVAEYGSAIIVPLKLEGVVIGSMQVLCREKNTYSADDMRMLKNYFCSAFCGNC